MKDDRLNYLIDAVSSIDEEIIERVSEKRFSLSCGARKMGALAKKMLFGGLAAVACLCLVLIPIFLHLFGGGGTVVPDEKQIPIYKGVTVSSTAPGFLTGDRGAHAVTVSKTVIDEETIRDAIDDFFDNYVNDGDGTSDDGGSSVDIEGFGKDMYYAEPGRDIYITVHLDNPDNFTILNFVLNGKTYASYMFEEGSDMETLVLKYNVGDVEGIQEYSVDAVKYVDGTDIKDAIMEGNRSVRVGVSTEKQPVASIEDETVLYDKVSFGVTVTDELGLITEEDEILAVLLDGEEVVQSVPILKGERVDVLFENLTPGHSYTWCIVANYDDLSVKTSNDWLGGGTDEGQGKRPIILYEKTAYLLEILSVSDLVSGKESISFYLNWCEEELSVKEILSVEILLGEEVTATVENVTELVECAGLLSDNEYTARMTYKYDLGEGEKESVFTHRFKTNLNYPPDLYYTFDNFGGDVYFNYRFVDFDSTLLSAKLKVMDGYDEIKSYDLSADETQVIIEGLEALHHYSMVLTWEYDRRDGKGTVTQEEKNSVMTGASVNILSHEVVGGEDVVCGDELRLYLTISNPSQVKINRVKINDHEYIAQMSSNNKVYVGIEDCRPSEKYGDTLVIQGYGADLYGSRLQVFDNGEYNIELSFSEEPTLLSVECVDADGNRIVTYSGGDVYLLFTLDNPSEYDIKSIDNYSTLTKIDYNHYTTPISQEEMNALIDSRTYSHQLKYFKGGKTESCECVAKAYYTVKENSTGEIKYVSTPEDLMDLDDGYIYLQTCDIDLAGIEWSPTLLRGVYDGCGFAISNMTMTGSPEEAASFGLFRADGGAAIVKNLTLNSVSVDVTVALAEFIYGAFLVDGGENCAIVNCTVDVSSDININVIGDGSSRAYGIGKADLVVMCVNKSSMNVSQGTAIGIGGKYVWDSENYGNIQGGNVGGISDGVRIYDSVNYGRLTAEKECGGIFVREGRPGDYEDVNIFDCINRGEIKGEYAAGIASGLTDGRNGTFSAFVENCKNESNVSGSLAAGGIVALTDICGYVQKCENYGVISGSEGDAKVGGIVGYNGEDSQIKECANYGKVEAEGVVAGSIVGVNGGAVRDCINYGEAPEEFQGEAYISLGGGTVENCENKYTPAN